MGKLRQYKTYFILTVSDLLSDFGDGLFYLALMNYIVSLPDARLAISIVSLSEMVPRFLPFLTGAIADRTKQKVNMILATLLLRFTIYIGVGLLMGFNAALWIVIVIASLNLISDISGQYESSLFIPISLPLVKDEDREQMIATTQTLKQTSSVLFQVLSAGIILLVSYQTLAFINAATFLAAASIVLVLRPQLEQHMISTSSTKTQQKMGIIEQYHFILHSLKQFPEVLLALTVAPLLNAVLVSMNTILLLMISTDTNFVIIDQKFTIALFPILISISAIIGSLLAMGSFKQIRLSTLIRVAAIGPVFVYLAFLLHSIYAVAFMISIIMITVSAVSPKLNAAFINNLPKDSLATIAGALGTIMQSGIVLMTLLLSGLMIVFSADIVVAICLSLAILIAGGTFIYAAKKGV